MRRSTLIFMLVLCILPSIGNAQGSPYYFNKLTVDDGLNDGTVTSVCQDKYGYMWFASLGGLNRYNGRSMQFFSHVPGDSTSPLGSLVECIALDSTGRLWLGFETGLMEFDYETKTFHRIPGVGDRRINSMIAYRESVLFLGTNDGLMMVDGNTGNVEYISPNENDPNEGRLRVFDLVRRDSVLYLACDDGVAVYDIVRQKVSALPIPEIDHVPVRFVEVSDVGDLWVGTYRDIQLMRYCREDDVVYTYNQFLSAVSYTIVNNLTGIYKDRSGKIWVTTTIDGLMEYLPEQNIFRKHLHSEVFPGSPDSDLHRSFFQDRDGTIWLGGNHGLNYFNPDKSFFHTILPFEDSLEIRNRRIARGIVEDHEGRFWLTTLDGVVRYDPVTGERQSWRNVLTSEPVIYYNSVRAATVDGSDQVWIATGTGVNRFSTQQDKMEFIPKENLPFAFYFSVNQDTKGRIWFGCRDYDSFYYYDPDSRSYHSIRDYPGLEAFAGLGGRYFFEDSKGRYWFGFNGNGLGMFEPAAAKTIRWTADMPAEDAIIGNLIVDIKEDNKGILWISTTNGISGINPETGSIRSFNSRNGLLSNSASALGIDAMDRLWIATTRGICVLDSSRTYFSSFGVPDGLPTSEFPEHPGYVAHNGDFIFPSNNGYVRFDPMLYTPSKDDVTCILSDVKVLNLPYPVQGEISELKSLHFNAQQDAFSFSIAALNYIDLHKTRYAYRLEGFDSDWQYSGNGEATYTNVPGGQYRFVYKASTDMRNWNSPERSIQICVATVFYRTWWFALIVLSVVGTLAFVQYRIRSRQQYQLQMLSTRSQQLEKEKALVMYEGLKQQLNPHFLFNSLTSLRSLIRTKPEVAGDFLDGLSRTYRYILSNRDNVTVSLANEIKFAETFVALQRTRFSTGFEVHFRIEETALEKKIAPVTLQNLIENAIKHNLIDADSPLVVDIYTEDNYLVVKNNLQRKEFVETSNKQGLESMRSYYRFLTDIPVIVSEQDGAFIIKIPLL